MLNEKPILFSGPMVRAILEGRKTVTRRAVKGIALEWLRPEGFTPEFTASPENGLCPYGKPGDRLWVRETWARIRVAQAPDQEWVVYRECDNRTDYGGPWKPGIHMFRRDSRILLEITDVRVERLHAITNEQCIAEGCSGGHGSIPGYIYNATPQEHFRHIWESVGGDYHANPWVWVIEFKRVTP